MPYETNTDLPEAVRENIPLEAQTIWRKTFNATYQEHNQEDTAVRAAWAAVKNNYEKKDEEWVKKDSLTGAELINAAYAKI